MTHIPVSSREAATDKHRVETKTGGTNKDSVNTNEKSNWGEHKMFRESMQHGRDVHCHS